MPVPKSESDQVDGPGKASSTSKKLFSHHMPDTELFPCEICGKTFNRNDNRRQHLFRHTRPDKSRNVRTKFDPRAVAMYEEQKKWQRKRAKSAKRVEVMKVD
ncbi:uncharacterized protein F4822DRAFT_435505 [Hypoxylon trugodes]|uniref:uncharacterized protein n=1 Tax=Hypoxylon trugodes TaxID=326681 RepID=UPI00218F2213|nr:uncharacterized protein F4822DRAFT_435505 [Hypoxylon trugodes]KAI1382511.1 hypothetical protein F4822DRAFT_435505 [Hypoxylon trugodes]